MSTLTPALNSLVLYDHHPTNKRKAASPALDPTESANTLNNDPIHNLTESDHKFLQAWMSDVEAAIASQAQLIKSFQDQILQLQTQLNQFLPTTQTTTPLSTNPTTATSPPPSSTTPSQPLPTAPAAPTIITPPEEFPASTSTNNNSQLNQESPFITIAPAKKKKDRRSLPAASSTMNSPPINIHVSTLPAVSTTPAVTPPPPLTSPTIPSSYAQTLKSSAAPTKSTPPASIHHHQPINTPTHHRHRSFLHLPTTSPTEKLNFLLQNKNPTTPTSPPVQAVSSLYFQAPLSRQALQDPLHSIKELFKTLTEISPLGISIISPNKFEIFLASELIAPAIERLQSHTNANYYLPSPTTLAEKDLKRRAATYNRSHFLLLRRACLQSFPVHLQLQLLLHASNSLPNLARDRQHLMSKAIQTDRAWLNPPPVPTSSNHPSSAIPPATASTGWEGNNMLW